MARRDWDDSESDWDDDFDQDAGDWDDDQLPLIECPFCRREIVEDTQRCPYCERYLSAEDAPPAQKPWWIGVGALVCLYLVYRWVVGW